MTEMDTGENYEVDCSSLIEIVESMAAVSADEYKNMFGNDPPKESLVLCASFAYQVVKFLTLFISATIDSVEEDECEGLGTVNSSVVKI